MYKKGMKKGYGMKEGYGDMGDTSELPTPTPVFGDPIKEIDEGIKKSPKLPRL